MKHDKPLDNISPEYKAHLQRMHSQNPEWGKSAVRFINRIRDMIDTEMPKHILDYGCGKASIARTLKGEYPNIALQLYDPGMPEYDHAPKIADMIICTDVLEHIEPDKIDDVLEHILSLMVKCGYFVIHTGDCGHRLPDGRPAHLLQQPQIWWEAKLIEAFRPRGFALFFADTGLPHRFEVKIVRINYGSA